MTRIPALKINSFNFISFLTFNLHDKPSQEKMLPSNLFIFKDILTKDFLKVFFSDCVEANLKDTAINQIIPPSTYLLDYLNNLQVDDEYLPSVQSYKLS